MPDFRHILACLVRKDSVRTMGKVVLSSSVLADKNIKHQTKNTAEKNSKAGMKCRYHTQNQACRERKKVV